MTLARCGQFELRHKNFVGEHKYTTHDIEICRYTNYGNCYTIADFNEDGDLVSLGERLLDSIEDFGDIADLKRLVKIGIGIVALEEVEI